MLEYQISEKPLQLEQSCAMWLDRQRWQS